MRKRAAIREQKYSLVRDEILKAATVLFATRGYRAVTIDDIAESIGFTKSAMYYYFENKYEILSTIFRDSLAHYLKQARGIAAQDEGPTENLRNLILQHTLNAIEICDWTTIFFREESELNEIDRVFVRKSMKEYGRFFASAYVSGVRSGVFKKFDSVMVVNGIIGACNAIVTQYRHTDSGSHKEIANSVVNLISQGYLIGADEANARAPGNNDDR
jgi:AcrR family transcriptional regulator